MYAIGIDVGGTNLAVGVVDEQGRILAESSRPTGVGRPYEEIIADMAACGLEAAVTLLEGGTLENTLIIADSVWIDINNVDQYA